MLCARPYCENKEDRIGGYCSEYCRDLHELQVEAEIHLTSKRTLQIRNERLREVLEKIAALRLPRAAVEDCKDYQSLLFLDARRFAQQALARDDSSDQPVNEEGK